MGFINYSIVDFTTVEATAIIIVTKGFIDC